MTLTFDIHLASCTHLVNCIYQLWHHRLQQFLKNRLFYLFPIQKHKGPTLTLPQNRSGSTQDHHLNKLGSIWTPDVAYRVSRSSAFWFQRRRFLNIFFHIWAWRLAWSCDQDHLNKLSFPHPIEAPYGIMILIGPVVSEEKMFKECGRRTTTTDDDGGLPIL